MIAPRVAGLVIAGAVLALLFKWGPAFDISETATRSTFPLVALDPLSGDLHIVWTEGAGLQRQVLHRRWRADIQKWIPISQVGYSPGDDAMPALLFDESGVGHIAWTRRYLATAGAPDTGTEIVYRQWLGEGWSAEELVHHVDSFLADAFHLILLPEPGGAGLVAVWGRGYSWAQRGTAGWSPLPPFDYSLGISLMTAARDEDNHWHFAAFGPNSGTQGFDPFYSDAYYTVFDGDDWTSPINVSGASGIAHAVDIAFDAAGQVHLLWSDNNPIGSMESAISTIYESVITDTVVISSSQVIPYNLNQSVQDLSLAADEKGQLHLMWSEGIQIEFESVGLNLHYQDYAQGGWSAETVLTSSKADSLNVHLVAGGDHLVAAWEEGPSTEEQIYVMSTNLDLVAPVMNFSYLPLVTCP